jgi:hypothetical protein
MKHIHLEDVDDTSVDTEFSIPEQSLRDLVCITENSITLLAGQMVEMSDDIKTMKLTMQEQFPKIVDKLTDLIGCMDRNTNAGVQQMEKLTEALKDR